MNPFDLHMHSCYSNDDESIPQELIHTAGEVHLAMIAPSDYNTPGGITDMAHLGEAKGIRIIPTMEFDTLFEELEVYVLGYGTDYRQPYFQSLFNSLSERKKAVQIRRVEEIREVSDLDIDPVALLKRRTDKNPFPVIVHHIMEQHKDKEELADCQLGGRRCEPQPVNSYWNMYSAGKPCYVRAEYPSLKDTMQRIHDVGGIAVLAYPWLNLYQKEERLQQALDEGINGIEAYSNYHEAKHSRYHDTYCRRHGVLVSYGSNSHGRVGPRTRMGEYGYEKDNGGETLQAFLKWLAE